MVSLIYGYDTGRVIRNSTPGIRMGLKIAGGLTTALSLIGAARSMYGQVKGMFGIEGKLIPTFSSKKTEN